MLCQFSFKNFKSYKNETEFDFRAFSTDEFSDSLIKRDKCDDLLPVSVFYGPNGGGKTAVLQALACLVTTVVRPVHELGKNSIGIVLQQGVAAEPFVFDPATANEPTEFQVYFRTDGYEYRYYLSLFHDEVAEESLDRKIIGAKRPAHLFDREGKNIELGAKLSKAGINRNINPKMPFLSFLSINYDIPDIARAQRWFESCIIRTYANPAAEQLIMFSSREEWKTQFLTALNDMDIDISGFWFSRDEKKIYLTHRVGEQDYDLSLDQESDGTKKMLSVLPMLLLALNEGRLIVIDELDAKLHPKLLEYVIKLFKNPTINRHGAQLLFTSHDISTMKNTVFRRDEIWFAALTEDRSSEIYTLYDIRGENDERVKSTAAFGKQYLTGVYGADPYLQNMLGEGWNRNEFKADQEK